jgi:hypothetical protein
MIYAVALDSGEVREYRSLEILKKAHGEDAVYG